LEEEVEVDRWRFMELDKLQFGRTTICTISILPLLLISSTKSILANALQCIDEIAVRPFCWSCSGKNKCMYISFMSKSITFLTMMILSFGGFYPEIIVPMHLGISLNRIMCDLDSKILPWLCIGFNQTSEWYVDKSSMIHTIY
jgi:hypothetical protein